MQIVKLSLNSFNIDVRHRSRTSHI